MIIFPQTCSHRILKYWKERNLLAAHVRTVPYGWGIAMAMACLDGIPASFSLRALGSVDMATRRAKAPLKVITYDGVFRPSHKEAYQTGILTESAGTNGIYIPTSLEMGAILQECSVYMPLQETITRAQIAEYNRERSDNVKIIADLFGIDSSSATLNEAGTHMSLSADGITANIPIEHILNYQYADALIKNKNRRK